MSSPNTPLSQRQWRQALAFVCLATLALTIGGYLFFRHETARIQEGKYHTLKAIAELKVGQLVTWRQERLADARLNATGILRAIVLQWHESPDDPSPKALLQERLALYAKLQGYHDLLLAGPDGRLLFSLNPKLMALDPMAQKLVGQTVAARTAVFGDLFRCQTCNQVHLDIMAPILDQAQQPVAVLILRIDPVRFLYPLIQSWPVPSESAETLLVRRQGESALFLNPLRHDAHQPLSHAIPLTRIEVPAIQAVLGRTGLFEGIDYQGQEVLSCLSPVPGSPWFMVAKMDRAEIMAEALEHGWFILSLVVLGVILTACLTAFLFNFHQRNLYRSLYQAERERRKAVEEFRITLYSIGDGVITTDGQGRIRQMNPVAEGLTGWPEAEAAGREAVEVFRIVNEMTRAQVESPVQKVLREGMVVGLANHTLLIAKDGEERPIADSGAPIRNEQGEISGVVLVFRDQSQERQILRQLQKLNRTYAVLSEVNQTIVRAREPQALFDQACRIAVEIGGFRLAWVGLLETRTRAVRPVAHAGSNGDFLAEMFILVDDTPRGGGPTAMAIRQGESVVANDIAQDQTMAPWRQAALGLGFQATVALPLQVGDEVIGCLNLYSSETGFFDGEEMKLLDEMARDLSFALEFAEQERKRKKAEGELMKLSQALEQSPAAVIITDIKGAIEYANPKFTEVTGFSPSEVLGRDHALLNSGEMPAAEYRTLWEEVKQGHAWRGEFHNRKKDGTLYWERASLSPIINSAGASSHFLIVKEDISKQKVMEEQLRQSQKMESVGRLAGGVAHDFNNMLGVILGYTELALEKVEAGQPLHADLQEILQAAHRSADLTRQLLAFARKQIVTPQLLDLNQTIEGTHKMLKRLIGEDIDLQWRPAATLWPVKIDPSQVDQIIANLAVNARDAIKGTGTLTIETNNVAIDESYCLTNPDCRPGDYVLLSMSDTGCGMDKATIAKIFEPFFTTKELGKGTGLGLATLYGVVKQNNGFVNVYSEPGEGSTFKIYLPRAQAVAGPESARGKPRLTRGTETVLLVEDEEGILQLGDRILSRYGYTVLAASCPTRALELAAGYQGPIHLLVTDIVMPEMNGKELMERVAQIRPGIKTLFMSGYTANVIAHHGVLEKDVQFMQKPFSLQDITTKVREVLDR